MKWCTLFLCFLLVAFVYGNRSDLAPVNASVTCQSDSTKAEYRCATPVLNFNLGGWTARASMVTATMNTTGWGTLLVETTGSTGATSGLQAYAAGFVEGWISSEQINLFWLSNQYNPAPKVVDFVNENNAWINANIKNSPKNDSAGSDAQTYWSNVEVSMAQLQGLVDGYNLKYAGDRRMQLTYAQLQYLQLQVELGDIHTAVYPASRPDFMNMTGVELTNYQLKHTHCSALFKATSSLEEVYASHVTWSTYTTMVRFMKTYNFPMAGVSATKVKYSGYPGTLAGIDDFYITSQKLAIIETSNVIYNNSLFDYVNPSTVPYWIRVMVANRIAKNSPEWHDTFYKYNSGTYNNQWMTFDYKLFEPGYPLKANTFLVSEQVVGHFYVEDQTLALERSFWPSYNQIFYPQLQELAGYQQAVEKHGVNRSYPLTPRARIFRRDAAKIESLKDMENFMRMNHYKSKKHDRLAHTPLFAISARGDLLNKKEGGPQMFGAIDGKIVSHELMNSFQIHAVSGPTHLTQPVFVWPNDQSVNLHYGQPEKFPFDWYDL